MTTTPPRTFADYAYGPADEPPPDSAAHTDLEHVDLTGPGPVDTAPAHPDPRHRYPGLPSDAKAAIMSRLRDALGGEEAPAPAGVDRDYRHERDEGTDLVSLFAERAEGCRALVVRADTHTMVDAAAGLLRRAGVRSMVVAPGERLAWLAATGAELIADEPPLTVDQLENAEGVVTGCALAIAETGTIVLDTGPDQGRRVLSLLPDYHLCVLRSDQIVGSVSEAVARLDPRLPQTWISGPSATHGIEMDRTEGVHGPRTLHVLLLA